MQEGSSFAYRGAHHATPLHVSETISASASERIFSFPCYFRRFRYLRSFHFLVIYSRRGIENTHFMIHQTPAHPPIASSPSPPQHMFSFSISKIIHMSIYFFFTLHTLVSRFLSLFVPPASQTMYTLATVIHFHDTIPLPQRVTHKSIKNLQSTENINPCNPFAKILVFNPLPNSPRTPSTAMTALAAAV